MVLRRVNILSINTTDDLIRKCSEIAWSAKSNHEKADGTDKRKNANELGYRAVKHILELLRIGDSELAIEIGITAIQMFSDGKNYHQVLSCIEGLRNHFEQSRLEDDTIYYENSAKISLENLDPKTLDGRMDILYNLVWENGCLGTSDAMRFFKEKTGEPICEPTILSYSKILKFEHRIISYGGPTGRPIEMFPNNSISLNRKDSYEKVNFFEGNLKAKSNLFKPVWDSPHRKNAIVYEIENGNDPRVFALIEPGISIPPKIKKLGGLSNMLSMSGVEGMLHPIVSMPKFGFKPIKEINDADFLTECKVLSIGQEGYIESTD